MSSKNEIEIIEVKSVTPKILSKKDTCPREKKFIKFYRRRSRVADMKSS